jgi:hypothetical protein
VTALGILAGLGLPAILEAQNLDSAFDPAASSVRGMVQIQPAPETQPARPICDFGPRVPAPIYPLEQRSRDYFALTYSPCALTGPMIGALWSQAWNSPYQWGSGFSGFGRRLGSNYARVVIGNTLGMSLAAIDHEDIRYYRSNLSGFKPRLKYALKRTLIARRTDGGSMLAVSSIVNSYSAAFIANSWYPPKQATFGRALERGSTAYASAYFFNVLQEFWPDIEKHVIHHRR